MTASNVTSASGKAAIGFAHVVLILAALTLVRIVALRYSAVDFYFDETQYWAWSRHLAFGYFSKPPLLAWIIAATDAVCGSGEACIRSASPLFYFGTSLLVYAIADELYDAATAAFAAILFALGPGLIFSARIVSTDVPLLFFWTTALLAYVKLLRAPDWRWTVVLGVAFGIGMLAKYAMVYFLLGVGLGVMLAPAAYPRMTRGQILTAILIAAAILAPNVLWNVANGFVTLKHTGDNISGSGFQLRPLSAMAFVGSQFGVAGPIVFGAFLVILAIAIRTRLSEADRLMLAFAIPALALVTALSFVRSAHENWAAPSAVSMTILAAAWWVRNGLRHWLWISFAIGVALQGAMIVGDAYAYRISVPTPGRTLDIYRPSLGWRPLAKKARELVRSADIRTVAADRRYEVAALLYYLRDLPVQVKAWPGNVQPDNEFDLTRPLTGDALEPVLFVSSCPDAERLKRDYADVVMLGKIVASTGPTTSRDYVAFRLAGHRGAIAPLGPCVAN